MTQPERLSLYLKTMRKRQNISLFRISLSPRLQKTADRVCISYLENHFVAVS